MIRIKRGLDLPIGGKPEQTITEHKETGKVAVLGPDYIGLRPSMAVRVGDPVKLGQVLFTHKKLPQVKFTAPAAGRVVEIHRGAKRALLSVVIQLEGDQELTFPAYELGKLPDLTREQVVEELLESGMWTALRTRPFSKVPDPQTTPHSLFVTAMDTNPLAPSAAKILEGRKEDFAHGLVVLSKLTDGKLFVCKDPETSIPEVPVPSLVVEEFAGPHPAGNVGTHIHFLDPVGRHKTVWHIGLQDVISVGRLFKTGRLHVRRVVALGGPSVLRPRLITTRLGVALDELLAGELKDGRNRVISGSVLSGHTASGPLAFLGRYHQQITVLPEGGKRSFLGWLSLGRDRHSVKNVVLSKLFPPKNYRFDTSTHGEKRAIIPTYNYERVMPLDIMALQLLRALAVDDIEEAEALGCLELDEEDLALCAYVCPSKLEFGPLLRRNLTLIEKEG